MKYAIIENDKVKDLIEAESMKAIQTFRPNAEIIKVSSSDMPFTGVGVSYDRVAQRFVPNKVFDSWVWDEAAWSWTPPVPHPGDGRYTWDEENIGWLPYTEPTK